MIVDRLLRLHDAIDRVFLSLSTVSKFVHETFALVQQCRSELHKASLEMEAINKELSNVPIEHVTVVSDEDKGN